MTKPTSTPRRLERLLESLLRSLSRRASEGLAPDEIEPATAVAAVSAGLVTMVKIVQGDPARLVITSAGKAWLRRRLAEGEDAFQSQHRQVERVTMPSPHDPGVREPVDVNAAESPLFWLRSRKLIGDAEYEAGERLRRDYTFAALGPRVTANWSAGPSSARSSRGGAPAAALRDDVIAAKERFHRAIEAVGPELGPLLIDVCCLLRGLEDAEAGQGLPKRSGKIVLQIALASLARHYGLKAPPRARPGAPAPIAHWGAADYKPVLDGQGQ